MVIAAVMAAPGGVRAVPGRGRLTVQWDPAVNENALVQDYEVSVLTTNGLPAFPTRRVLSGVRSLANKRRTVFDGVPTGMYKASVRTTPKVGAASAATVSDLVEVAPANGSFGPFVAWMLRVLALAAVVAGVVVLVRDPVSTGKLARVDLNVWAIAIGVLMVAGTLAFVASVVRPGDILSGADHRISTSRLNVAMWTVAIAFGLVTLTSFAFGASHFGRLNPCNVAAPNPPTAHNAPPTQTDTDRNTVGVCVNGHTRASTTLGFSDLFHGGLTPNYLVLLGAPFAALAGASFVVNRQLTNGTRQKVESVDPSRFVDALTNDNGDGDLVDTQYLVFSVVLLFYFLTNFLPNPTTLPDLPWGLVGLTGVTAGTYLLNKSVATNGLSVIGLSPTRASIGQSVHITGLNFLPEGSAGLPSGGVTVWVDDKTARIVSATNTEVVFAVPQGLTAGSHDVQIKTAANVAAQAGTLVTP